MSDLPTIDPEDTPAESTAAAAVRSARLLALNALPRGCLYGVSDRWLRSLRWLVIWSLVLQSIHLWLLVWILHQLLPR